MVKEVVRRYSMGFKQQVIGEYEKGASLSELHRKYGIPNGATIKRWIKKHSRKGLRHQVIHIQSPQEREESKELQERVRELEKLVAQLSLDKLMLESSLKVAEERLGYEVKKKRAAK